MTGEAFERWGTALEGIRHHRLKVSGLRMHLAEAGRGEPVLLLHGFPQHWWAWRSVMPALARRHRVLAPDLRGAGWTDAPATGYRRDQLLRDILALLDACGLERVHLVAHDWSALVGYRLCLLHPERVRSYVALGPHPFVDFDPRMLPGLWRLWFQPLLATPVLGAALLRAGRQRLARHLLLAYAARQEVWSAQDLERFLSRLWEPARAQAASRLYRQFILPEMGRIMTGWYKARRLTTPTVVLHGQADRSFPAALLGKAERYADDLTVRIVEGAAHYLADERPDVVAAEALQLFARH